MSMSKLFRIAFEEGCGISFDKVVRSREFRRMLRRELSIYDRYPESCWQGRRLRDNSYGISLLVNAHYYGLELKDDKSIFEPRLILSKRDLVIRALFRILGKKLIERAKKMLPESCLKLAEDFKAANDTEGRMVALVQFYSELLQIKQVYDRESEDETERLYGWVNRMTNDYDYRRALPNSFSKFGEGTISPQCGCMGMMLVAWARMAKVPVMLGNHVNFSYKRQLLQFTGFTKKILDEVSRRNLIISQRYRDTFAQDAVRHAAFRGYFMDFHAGIVAKFANNGWLFLDPYADYLGVLWQDEWQPETANRVIEKIDPVAPGFSLVSNDAGRYKRSLNSAAARTRRAFRKSKELEENIPKRLSAIEARRYLRYSKDCRYLRWITQKCFPKSDTMTILTKYLFDIRLTERLPRKLQSNCWEKFENDHDYQSECRQRLLTAPLVFAYLLLTAKSDKTEVMINNVPEDLEFSSPEFTIALHLINNLAAWYPGENKVDDLFLKHSTSHLLWSDNVLHLQKEGKNVKTEPRVQAAKRLLDFLSPHIHDYCKARMSMVFDEKEAIVG